MEASSPQIMWQSALPRRFGIILEKILDRHERSGIAVQWNGGGLKYMNIYVYPHFYLYCSLHKQDVLLFICWSDICEPMVNIVWTTFCGFCCDDCCCDDCCCDVLCCHNFCSNYLCLQRCLLDCDNDCDVLFTSASMTSALMSSAAARALLRLYV